MTALFVIAKTWKQPKSPSTIIKWLNKLWKWKLLSLTLCDPMDYPIHGILQARILEWVAIPFSRGCSQPRDRTQVSHIAGGFFTSWATSEAYICTITNIASLYLYNCKNYREANKL